MPSDYSAWQPVTWAIRDWRGKEKLYKTLRVLLANVEPRTAIDTSLYIVPSGKVLYVTNVTATTNVTGEAYVRVEDKYYLFDCFFENYGERNIIFGVPLPVEAGEEIRCYLINNDIRKGTLTATVIGWEEPE